MSRPERGDQQPNMVIVLLPLPVHAAVGIWRCIL